MLPFALFAASALVGAWISSDSAEALRKLVLVGAGLGLYVLLLEAPVRVEWQRRQIRPLRVVVAGIPVLLAVYFLLTNDWKAPVEKIVWLDPVRDWLAGRAPRLPLPPLHPNVVGGVLAMWLPLQIAALAPRPDPRRPPSLHHLLGSPGAFVLIPPAAALVLSGLRGAWLALALALSVQLVTRLAGRWGRLKRFALVGIALGCMLAAWTMWGDAWLAARPDRLLVWRNSWHLAWDYAFTGLGLGNFTMPYSSYALLTHVPHTTHAHNLFLDLWLEQGLLGVLAFAALALAALLPPASDPKSRAEASRWREAGLMGLVVVVAHGLVDDVYYGYGGLGAALLFAPLALVARSAPRRLLPRSVALGRVRVPPARVLLASAATLAVVAALQPSVRALWQSNVGAFRQTRVELSVYRWPEWPIQDAVRTSRAELLADAVAHYKRALALNPQNAPAIRRLGQIELSLGQFDSARRHLVSAYRSAPNHQATGQLYGESLAVTGEPARAAKVWQGLHVEGNRIEIREWWHRNASDRQRAQWMSEAVALTTARSASQDRSTSPAPR